MSSNSETLNFVVNSTNQTQLTHPGDSAITSQTSDKIKGDGYYGRADGLHTVQYNVTSFVTQATLATNPVEADYFTLSTTVHDNISGPANSALADGSFIFNFTGNYVYVRAIVSDWVGGTVNSILINH